MQQVAKLMKDQGFSLEVAMKYFDDDQSGTITRAELVEGFKRMKVTLNERLIKNIFAILDRNCDNEITLQEFEAVFDKYLGTGGPVADVKAEDLQNDIIDAAAAKDLEKQMNQEKKQKIEYADQTLESIPIEELEKIEE